MKYLVGIIILVVSLLLSCTDGERMRHELAGLQARNQADSLLTDDSLALALTDYFDRHGTANERMLAHYLLGRTYADMGEAPAALDAYLDAANCADTNAHDCNYSILARIHGQTANLFYSQALYRSQLAELDVTEKYAWKAHDTVVAINSLSEKAFAYHQMNICDSAYINRLAAVKQFYDCGYYQYAAITEGALIPILLDMGLYQEIPKSISAYESLSGYFDDNRNIQSGREIYYYYKGLYYLHSGRTDSAEILFRKELRDATDINNQLAGSRGLMLVYKQLCKYDSLAKYAEACYVLNDSSTNLLESEQVLKISTLYNYDRNRHIANQKTIEADNARHLSTLLIVVILGLIITAYLIYVRIKQKQNFLFQNYLQEKRQLAHLQTLLRELQKEKSEQLTSISKLENEVEQLKNSVEAYKAQHLQRIQSHTEDNLNRAAITQKFLAMQCPPFPHPTESDWQELQSLVLQEIPEFYASLQSRGYCLTAMEYRICILIRLHFKPSAIALILDKDLTNVSKIRQRLLQKVFHVEGSSKDFDQRILSIY